MVLGLPGSDESSKAYYEPGGSFSPEFGSFGVSIWVTDPHGVLLETSDSIPLQQIGQNFAWRPGAVTPSIETQTQEYSADWSLGSQTGVSQLVLKPNRQSGNSLVLVIRSVGPAGSAIESLKAVGTSVVVNGRFKLTTTPAVATFLGPEGVSGWKTSRVGSTKECYDHDGWCYARLGLPKGRDVTLRIEDMFPRQSPELASSQTRSHLQINLPDRRFEDSLNAQVAHIVMGTVGIQTRPGEPNHYPLAFLRDGAYQVVALARLGQLETARVLTREFAERDFFGGNGAEGDSPGFSLWVMEEVASRLRHHEYDEYLWPHVYRKAQLILGMKETRQSVERISSGPLIPFFRGDPDTYTIAHPARDGLVVGRMDQEYRGPYATAISYLGLQSAAKFAARLGRGEDARRWRAAASQLRQAWNAAYRPTDSDEHTFFTGVWPAGIASDPAQYLEGLGKQWADQWNPAERAPMWTYVSFAMAHQYLLLGQPERTWQTLVWFWDHQPSPGFYTWWEGNPKENTDRIWEENNAHDWDYVRGWVAPAHVSPHYWSAAECLLMQLDMLAYVDTFSAEPEVVIGGGIPATWTRQSMHAHGLSTSLGPVDWDWDGKLMVVRTDKKVPV